MTLTRADLKGVKTTNAVHYDSRTEAVWSFGVEGFPRLGVVDVYVRKTKQSRRTWSVDNKPVRDLDAALAVLNGTMTLEEAMAQDQPEQAQRPKKSLSAQIAEVEYELRQREKVYPGIAGRDPRKRAELDLHVETMEAVKATLMWLQENEAMIKQRASY